MQKPLKLSLLALLLAAAAGITYYLLTPHVDFQAEAEKLIPTLTSAAPASRPAAPLRPPSLQQPTFSLDGHTEGISSLAFSPDGKLLASGSGDHSIRLWDLATRKSLAVLHGHTNAVTALSFSPDGKFLLSGGADNAVDLWNLTTREIDNRFPHPAPVLHVAFLPDGKHFLSATSSLLQKWSTDDESPLPQKYQSNLLRDFQVAPDGTVILVQSDGALLWDAATAHITNRLRRPAINTASINVGPAATLFAVRPLATGDLCFVDEAGLFLWRHTTDEFSCLFLQKNIRNVAASADGPFFITSGTDTLQCFNNTGIPLAPSLRAPELHDFALSPDHTLLVLAQGGVWQGPQYLSPNGPTPLPFYDVSSLRSLATQPAPTQPARRPATRAASTRPGTRPASTRATPSR